MKTLISAIAWLVIATACIAQSPSVSFGVGQGDDTDLLIQGPQTAGVTDGESGLYLPYRVGSTADWTREVVIRNSSGILSAGTYVAPVSSISPSITGPMTISQSGTGFVTYSRSGTQTNLFGLTSGTVYFQDPNSSGILGQFGNSKYYYTGTSGVWTGTGTGAPEGVDSAPTGSIKLRSNGASRGNTLYVKETGGTGNTGWTSATPLVGTATYDAPSIAAGATEQTTVTVTGAAVGDITSSGLTTLTTQIVMVSSSVSAADTVTVTFFNPTGSPIDLSSGTLTAHVRK